MALRTTLTLALLGTCLPLAELAIANDGAALEEVVVSAARRDVSPQELSAAIGVVETETIRAQKLVTDALSATPGVFLQQTTPGQGAAVVRGLKGSSVLHLVDGMRLNNAIFRSAPTQYLALVPISAVDHIETLRGTPASLYGSDAVGGIINVVTRAPRFASTESRAAGDVFAAYDTAELARAVRATLDVGNRDVATSLSLEHLTTGNRRTGGGERIAPSGFTARGGRFVMSVSPQSDSAWLFDVHYMEQPDTPRVDELVPGFDQTEPSSSEFAFAPNRRLFAHARYDRKAAALGLDWRVDLAWQRIDDDRVTRAFGSDVRRIEQNRSDLSGAVVTASRTTSTGNWLVGVELYHDKVRSARQEQDTVSGAVQQAVPRFPDGASLDRAALFVNAGLPLTERQALTGGVRLSSERVELPQTAVSSATDLDVTDVSGDVGWRFDVDNRWQLVANLGYGFRAPNVFDLGTFGERPGNRFNVPNTALDSERVLHGDAGIRRIGDGWRVEVVAFALDYDDRITTVATGDTTPDGREVVQSVNAASASVRGLEVGASIALGEALQLEAIVNYTYGAQDVGAGTEPADRIPPLGGRLLLAFDNDGPYRVHAWIDFADRQDRLSARDAGDVRIDPNGTPGWVALGASTEWRLPSGWHLSLALHNGLDRRYRRHGSGIDAAGRGVTAAVRYVW